MPSERWSHQTAMQGFWLADSLDLYQIKSGFCCQSEQTQKLTLFLQVWPPDGSRGLCGMSDALYSNGGRGQATTTIWEGQKTPGVSEWWGSVHDAVQSDRKAQSAHDHHDIHGKLCRQHPDADSGKENIKVKVLERRSKPNWLCLFSATPRHNCGFSFNKIVSETEEDSGGQSLSWTGFVEATCSTPELLWINSFCSFR